MTKLFSSSNFEENIPGVEGTAAEASGLEASGSGGASVFFSSGFAMVGGGTSGLGGVEEVSGLGVGVGSAVGLGASGIVGDGVGWPAGLSTGFGSSGFGA